MKKLIFVSLIIGVIVVAGCTYYDTSEVPFCEDINKTGTDCHSPDDMDICSWEFDEEDKERCREGYNYSAAICKNKVYSPALYNEMSFCFDTLDDSFNDLADKFKKCWNCPEEDETIKISPNLPGLFETEDWIVMSVQLRIDEKYKRKPSQSEEEWVIIETKRKEIFSKATDNFISTLPESEFKLIHKLTLNNFYGNFTRKGFEILIESDLVQSVWEDFLVEMVGEKIIVGVCEAGRFYQADEECILERPENKCVLAGDCSSNMDLEGCSYDGCNYCCNDFCTVMKCVDIDNFFPEPEINSDVIFKFRWEKESEIIPENYKEIVIYETICDCVGGTFCNNSYPMSCSCNRYCYNQSRIIWVPSNECEMPIHCYVAGQNG